MTDKDLEEELKRFFEINNLYVDPNDLQTIRHYNGSSTDKRYYFEDIARHFAQWQKEQVIEKACEWLQKHMNDYLVHGRDIDFMYNDFRKAMED